MRYLKAENTFDDFVGKEYNNPMIIVYNEGTDVYYTDSFIPEENNKYISSVNKNNFYINGEDTPPTTLKLTSLHDRGTDLSIQNFEGNEPNIEYSFDGVNWNTWDYSTIFVAKNESIYLKGNNPTGFSHSASQYSWITAVRYYKLSGNLMSLIDGMGYEKTIPNDYCFYNLFYYGNCVDAGELDLYADNLKGHCFQTMFAVTRCLNIGPKMPARHLAPYCYTNMFQSCDSLNYEINLPGEIAYDKCYYGMFNGCFNLKTVKSIAFTSTAFTGEGQYCREMFNGCTNLTTIPDELPCIFEDHRDATGVIWDDGAYHSMFKNCTNITKAPNLPSLNVPEGGYNLMFYGCTSLVDGPNELPATTLIQSCYNSMFYGCSSLINAPHIKATNLMPPNGRYSWSLINMFANCSSLASISLDFPFPATGGLVGTLDNWCSNVASSGTLYVKDSTWTVEASSSNNYHGYPAGWNVIII